MGYERDGLGGGDGIQDVYLAESWGITCLLA
jgi:hypothetical protein